MKQLLRGAYSAWLKLLYGRRGMTTAINNELFRIAPSARSIAPWARDHRTRVYEAEIWDFLLAALRPDDVVVDVGANFGIYAIACARRLAEGKVWAVEPDPHNAKLLRQHVQWNGVAGIVTVIEAAAGDEGGTIQFSALGTPQSGVAGMWGSGRGEQPVELLRLDEAIPRSDLLKIDVEGYEGRVLAGASGLLSDPARRPRVIVVEVHSELLPRAGWSVGRLRRFLVDHDYRVDDLDAHHAQQHWIGRDRRSPPENS